MAAIPTPTRRQCRRVRTPTVIQMEAVECGAAALAIVLSYYRRYVPLEELRVEAGVSRDGSNALNVLKVARTYGLEANGFKKEPADLLDLPLPMILFWNFNHFVVLEGFDSRGAFLNDPASGPRHITFQELDRSFTGVVLTFAKTPAFQPGGERRTLMNSLRKRLKGQAAGLAYVMLASFLLVIPGIITPAFISTFVDNILTKHLYSWTLWLLVAILLTAVVDGFLTWLQAYYLQRLQTRMALSWSSSFLWHVLSLPMEFYAQRFSGEVGSRVSLNDRVASLLSGRLATAVMNGAMIVFFLAIMFFYDVSLTLLAILLALVNFAALSLVGRIRKDTNAALLQDQGKLLGTTLGGFQMMETLKSTGRESDFFSRWAGYQAKVVNGSQEMGRATQVVSVLPSFVSAIGNILILCLGGLKVMNGTMTLGMVMAFQSLMGRFLGPVNSLVSLGADLQEAEGDMNRLEDVLYNKPQEYVTALAPEDAQGRVRLSGRLEMRKVTFGYSRLHPALIEDFDLVVEAGQRIALVGATGSGKSTLSKLTCGLYRPWSGEILFDDRSRDEIPRPILTGSVAQVDQDILLFAGTIRENLTLWDSTIPDAQLVAAARDAAIYDAILTRPGGFDGEIEEGGANFSGGERQRLEIARALVGNPSILVLDEATSSLDPVVEKSIDQRLRARGCTCLIIAHRLSTIRDADLIIVLHQGKVVQRGVHEDLIQVDGYYRRLIQAEPGAVVA